MKLSTSTRISLLFAGTTAMILLIVAVLVSLFYYNQRSRVERRMPEKIRKQVMSDARPMPPQPVMSITKEELEEWFPYLRGKEGVVRVERDRWFMIQYYGQQVSINDISRPVERQLTLMRIMAWMVLIGTFLSFFIGKVFVRYAFRDMRVLAQKVDSLSINNLAFTDTFKHLPENDDIKLVANALQKMSTLLDEQVSDIKQFVADASHELRTPLMILRSSSELAHKTQQYDALYDKQQTTIKRMEGLIDALLALSRGEMIEGEKHGITLQSVVNETVGVLSERYADKKHHITIDVDSAIQVQAYPGTLDRIVMNLLDNACKYTQASGTISVHATSQVMTITDTGPGIPQDMLEKIREPFWQEDASRSLHTGYGLGLPLVKRLVTANNWKIVVDSTLGEGTSFTVLF